MAVEGQRVDLPRAMRDAGLTALLAFGLFLPLIGFQTLVNGRNELVLTTRWPLLLAIVAAVGIARLGFSLGVEPWIAQRKLRPPATAVPAWREAIRKWFVSFAIGFVVVYPPLVILLNGFGSSVKWIDNFGIQILIYVMLGWGDR